MGEIKLPRHMFLWSMCVIYMFAFASLYVQIPGLYGNDGILPARWQLRFTGKSAWELLQDEPTLLWLGPRFGLDTQQGMELLCLLGALLSLGGVLLEPLRDSLMFFALWVLYRSVYQVGQVFLYFQWDSLLLETGLLTIFVAPLNLLRRSPARQHDPITFWLVRWLLFRLMFASGIVKLTSRCPTWWGLTALTYHYETQCIPSPLAWYAHQLPVWFQKLSVVATFVIEIATPFLFFSPMRRLRIGAFYMQVLLQVLIILTGNYNFFNILTIILCFSLLDDDHVNFWLGKAKKAKPKSSLKIDILWMALLIEVSVYILLVYWTVVYFGLEINWEKRSVSSKTEFTYHEFNGFLKEVTFPSIWLGLLSLAWEVVTAMFRCACIRGFFWKLLATIQWAIFATATAGMFAISLVPYTFIEYDSHSNVWPSLRRAYRVVDRYQVVGSYGLFRRMTGLGGRPEVVIEGSMDKNTWTEIEFMYKPGNLSGPQPVVAPHQPRLDWQMWFAALGHHSQSPWFPSLVHRLLQGNKDVINLIQVDESRYPFSQKPPTFIRARLYKYWFTNAKEDGWLPERWWRRKLVDDFFPAVYLGDPVLNAFLSEQSLKNKGYTRRSSDTLIPWVLRLVREHVRPMTGPQVLWSLFGPGAVICLLKVLCSRAPRGSKPKPAPAELKSRNIKEMPPPTTKEDQVQENDDPAPSQQKGESVSDSDRGPKKRK